MNSSFAVVCAAVCERAIRDNPNVCNVKLFIALFKGSYYPIHSVVIKYQLCPLTSIEFIGI